MIEINNDECEACKLKVFHSHEKTKNNTLSDSIQNFIKNNGGIWFGNIESTAKNGYAVRRNYENL